MIALVGTKSKISVCRGDAVYDVQHVDPDLWSEPHAGIAAEDIRELNSGTQIRVVGLPAYNNTSALGESIWCSGDGNKWEVGAVGSRRRESGCHEETVAKILRFWDDQSIDLPCSADGSKIVKDIRWSDPTKEHPKQFYLLGPRHKKVDPKRTYGNGHPLFVTGTCVGFVEYCYELAGLNLVIDDNLDQFYTTQQICAFCRVQYPLDPATSPWRSAYPGCCDVCPEKK